MSFSQREGDTMSETGTETETNEPTVPAPDEDETGQAEPDDE